jgi:hypothetical protein
MRAGEPKSDQVLRAITGSIVVPAHDEARTITRLLDALVGHDQSPAYSVVVVCNGCSDNTADLARAVCGVDVVETSVADKWHAMSLGDRHSTAFPRLYVDADVVLDRHSAETLLGALEAPGVLAVGPRRFLAREGLNPLVRWYYDVWEQLPSAREGLFGRGVVGVSRAGHDRVSSLPPAMSDDLVFSEAFTPGERRVVEGAVSTVYPPRRVRDLVRRRIRVVTGVAQADAQDRRSEAAKTSWGDLRDVAVAHPGEAGKVLVFVAVTLWARLAAAGAVRRGDYSTWLRDESSRP